MLGLGLPFHVETIFTTAYQSLDYESLKEGDLPFADRVFQSINQLEHSLNMNNNYASYMKSGSRELIQNWMDRCQQLGKTMDRNAVIKVKKEEGNFSASIELGRRKPILLGSLITTGNRELILINYATNLPVKSLVLGAHDKGAAESISAGVYGEGMKVEINQLIKNKVTVQYRSGEQRWSFHYNSQGVLTMTSYKEKFFPHLIVYLGNLPTSIPPLPREDYLFLQSDFPFYNYPYNPEKSVLSGIRLLLSDQHKGKLFLHGIFVKKDDQAFPTFGLCFDGAKSGFKYLSIGRDRNTMDPKWLIPEIFRLVIFVNDQKLNKLIYTTMRDYPQSDLIIRSIRTYNLTNSEMESLGDCLVAAFKEFHPFPNIPVSVQATDLKEEIEYLQHKPVKVSEELYTLLSLSKNCPSVEKAWVEWNSILESLPAYQFIPNSAEEKLAHSIAEELTQIFKPFVRSAEYVHWKDFSFIQQGNQRCIHYSPELELFIIDTSALSVDQVHAKSLEEDASFTCDGKRCVCMKYIVMQSMLETLVRKKLIKQKDKEQYQRRMTRHYMNRGEIYLVNVTSSEAIKREESRRQLAERNAKEQEEVRLKRSSEKSLLNSVYNNLGFNSLSNLWGNGNNGEEMKVAGRLTVDDLKNKEGNRFVPKDLIDKASAETSRVLASAPRTVDISYKPEKSDEDGADSECRQSNIYTANDEMKVGYDSIYLPTPIPKPLLTSGVAREELEDLIKLNVVMLRLLFFNVFKQNGGDRSPFLMFCDPDGVAYAFNRDNQLWFNLASRRGDVNLDLVGCFSAWYLTICHEYGHVQATSHGAAFARIHSQLTLRFSAAFTSCCGILEAEIKATGMTNKAFLLLKYYEI